MKSECLLLRASYPNPIYSYLTTHMHIDGVMSNLKNKPIDD